MSRIVTGLILAIGWLLLLLVGSYPLFCLVITAGSGVALYEFLRMSLSGSEYKLTFPVLVLGVFPLLGASLWGTSGMTSSLFLAFIVLIILTVVAFPTFVN